MRDGLLFSWFHKINREYIYRNRLRMSETPFLLHLPYMSTGVCRSSVVWVAALTSPYYFSQVADSSFPPASSAPAWQLTPIWHTQKRVKKDRSLTHRLRHQTPEIPAFDLSNACGKFQNADSGFYFNCRSFRIVRPFCGKRRHFLGFFFSFLISVRNSRRFFFATAAVS